jgi:hypothetical protein
MITPTPITPEAIGNTISMVWVYGALIAAVVIVVIIIVPIALKKK